MAEETVRLISVERDVFTVSKAVANMSGFVNNYAEDDEDTPTEFELPNVSSEILKKVIEFCEHYLTEPMTDIEKPIKSSTMSEVVQQQWYAEFVNIDQNKLFKLILAANYMDIKPLLDLTSATVATMIKSRTPEEIRTTFDIKNDFTPEQEEEVKAENKWCEEA